MHKKRILLTSKKTNPDQREYNFGDVQDFIDEFLKYYRTIDYKEWRYYIEFISASLHKKNKHTPNLAERVKEAMKGSERSLIFEDLVLKCTPARANYPFPAKVKALSDEFNNLIKLTKQYLVYKQVMDSSIDFQHLLTKRLKRRNDNDLFRQTVHDFELILQSEAIKPTIMISMEEWWLAHQSYYHQYSEQISNSTIFQRNLEAYEEFHQLVTLRNYLEYLNRNQRTVETDCYQLKEKVDLIRRGPSPERILPVVTLYGLLIRSFEEYEDSLHDNYFSFKDCFFQLGVKIAPVDQLVLAKTVINYLEKPHYKQGGTVWLKEIFEWMQYLNRECLYEFEGTISDDEYLNYVLVGIALNEFKAFEQFEAKYTSKLDSGYKDHVLNLCQVYYLQKLKKSREALKILDTWFPLNTSDELKYNLRAKVLRVMLNLENGEVELRDVLYNLSKFCGRLVERLTLTEAAVEPYLRFHDVVKQLNQYYYPNPNKKEFVKKQAFEMIHSLMASEGHIAHRLWLEEKIAGLK